MRGWVKVIIFHQSIGAVSKRKGWEVFGANFYTPWHQKE
jgi:hypothetical protein